MRPTLFLGRISVKIGIGLPSTYAGVDAGHLLDWARKADAGPFSSLAIIDRLVYPNYEPLILLGAIASVTSRVRLMPAVLLAPLRNSGMLAKQAATLDALSAGRLSLGLGIGIRQDDYLAAPSNFHDRGKRFDEQLALMRRVWSGEAVADGVGPIGPAPVQEGGPEVLIGGRAPAAISRVGRWADGYLASPVEPARVEEQYALVLESWREHEREGRPRLVGTAYFALGPGALERAVEAAHQYYTPNGPAVAKAVANSIYGSPKEVRDGIRRYADIGMDELAIFPGVADSEELDRLADVVS
ncbi:MAG: Flavin-dependent oxidoreductase, luciferase family [Chloroflexi bacterium]|nr:MAG: Flavin-dependent oxidoreductase, luciferase family [Chloroflexota bacterium]